MTIPSLPGRQMEILLLAADGLSNAQTARQLRISVDTVKTYRRRIMRALGAVTTTHAVAIAYRSGLIPLPLPRRCPVCHWAPGANPNQLRRTP